MLGQLFTLADVKAPLVRAMRLTAAADIALAVGRIDLQHRELCALAPWPLLHQTTWAQTVTAGQVQLTAGLGVSGVCLSSTKEPFWYINQADLSSGDLSGRRVWTTASAVSGKAVIALWMWDSEAERHVAETEAVDVFWWQAPGVLSGDTDALALPGTRALLARSVCDLIGLMDRREMDAAPWRQEYESGVAEMLLRAPQMVDPRVLHIKSGRVLQLAPSMLQRG